MKPLSRLLPVIIAAFFLSSIAFAAPTTCPEHFASGQAPDLINQKLAAKTEDLCYSGFALKHSGVAKTPLYAVEHLTRERLAQARGLKRSGNFHPDPNLPASERAELTITHGLDLIEVMWLHPAIRKLLKRSKNALRLPMWSLKNLL